MFVGVCRLDLHIPGSRSLKQKRHALRKIRDRTWEKFRVTPAEVGSNDLWQRAQIGFAVVGNEGGHVSSMVDSIADFIEGLYLAQILERRTDVMRYGDDSP